jgi:hypothetical protein
MPIYDQTAAHSFLGMLDPMAAHIIESVDVEPAPLRMVFGSQALETTLTSLRKRIADFETQTQLAASTDFPPGHNSRNTSPRILCERREPRKLSLNERNHRA